MRAVFAALLLGLSAPASATDALDGRLMLALHRPFKQALAKFYEMRDAGDRVEVLREAVELDGEAYPKHGCPMETTYAGC